MGQKDGERWTAAVDLQPTIPKSDRLLKRPAQDAAGEAQVFLEVEDDGPGIPAAERTRVLERFYRVPGTGGEGNGLGLAIADEIARAHRAQLTLEAAGSRDGVACGLRVRLVMRSPA